MTELSVEMVQYTVSDWSLQQLDFALFSLTLVLPEIFYYNHTYTVFVVTFTQGTIRQQRCHHGQTEIASDGNQQESSLNN